MVTFCLGQKQIPIDECVAISRAWNVIHSLQKKDNPLDILHALHNTLVFDRENAKNGAVRKYEEQRGKRVIVNWANLKEVLVWI